jgi:hypothetical protein
MHGIKEDGFSRPCFAREHRQPGTEREGNGIDKDKVANRQFEKHGKTPEVEGRSEEAGSLTSLAVTLLRAGVFWPKR